MLTKLGNQIIVNEETLTIELVNKKNEVIRKDICKDLEDLRIATNNFQILEQKFMDDYKSNKKRIRNQIDGNYKHTKYGKIMNAYAEQIKEATGNVVRNIKISKSEQSDSKYIILEMGGYNYTIRLADHDRKSYEANGNWWNHQYDQDVRVTNFNKINWSQIVEQAVEDILEN